MTNNRERVIYRESVLQGFCRIDFPLIKFGLQNWSGSIFMGTMSFHINYQNLFRQKYELKSMGVIFTPTALTQSFSPCLWINTWIF